MNTLGRSKLARLSKVLDSRGLFFYEHAGYGYDPTKETKEQGRIRCAQELARAEAYVAEYTDWGFSWDYDSEGCSGCECGSPDCACSAKTPHETLWCSVREAEGKVLASLCGICSPSPEYSRVIEAELAQEAIEGMREYGAEHNV